MFPNLFAPKAASNREPYSRFSSGFPRIDIARDKKELNLSLRGKTNGEKDYPSSESSTFDDVEEEIVHRVKSEYSDAVDYTQLRINQFNQSLQQRSASIRADELMGDIDSLLGKLDLVSQSINNALHIAKEDATLARQEEAEFKRAHGLSRLPQLPESKVFKWGVLVFILLAETILNGMFYSVASESGLIGGISVAFGLAVVNLALGVALGMFAIPHLNHKSQMRKMLGIVSGLFLIASCILWNMFVGHYREAFVEEGNLLLSVGDRGRIAVSSMIDEPFMLYDGNSWVLVAIGIICFVVAAVDSYGLNDPYPGYGAVTRKVKDAKREFIRQTELAHQEFEKIRSSGESAIRKTLHSLSSDDQALKDIKLNHNKLLSDFNVHMEHLSSVANALLKAYRRENEIARQSAAPKHFGEEWILSMHVEKPAFPEIELASLDDAQGRAREQVASQRDRFHQVLKEAQKEVKNLEDLE